jgi:hypothetical protein
LFLTFSFSFPCFFLRPFYFPFFFLRFFLSSLVFSVVHPSSRFSLY